MKNRCWLLVLLFALLATVDASYSEPAFTIPIPQFGNGTGIATQDDGTKILLNKQIVFSQHDSVHSLIEIHFGTERVAHQFFWVRLRNGLPWATYQSGIINPDSEEFPISAFSPMMPDAFPGYYEDSVYVKWPGGAVIYQDSLKFEVKRTDPDFEVGKIIFCKGFTQAENGELNIFNQGTYFHKDDNVQIVIPIGKIWTNYDVKIVLSLNGKLQRIIESPVHDVIQNGGYWEFGPYYYLNPDKQLGEYQVEVTVHSSSGYTLKQEGVYRVVDDSVNVAEKVIHGFSLKQNYPNPFNPSTLISFVIPEEMFTTIDVYNVSGQKVANLLSSRLIKGDHTVTWNAEGLSAGVYICVIKTGARTQSMKMVLTK